MMQTAPVARNSSGTVQFVGGGGQGVVGRVLRYQRARGGESIRRHQARKTADKDSVVISAAEFGYMARSARIETAEERKKVNQQANDIRIKQIEKAKARKAHMQRMEEERKQRAPLRNAEEEAQLHAGNSLLAYAKRTLDEELDDVKHMNQMTLYAKCVTIRDQQLLEKKRMREQAIKEDKRADAAMEVERIKALKVLEQRERTRAIESRKAASISRYCSLSFEQTARVTFFLSLSLSRLDCSCARNLNNHFAPLFACSSCNTVTHQIAERERKRQVEVEQREQEAAAMVERIKELEAKEQVERERKHAAGRKLLEEVMRANNAQARQKVMKRREEIEEDRRIADYLREKDLREQQQEEDLERIQNSKALEVARLRSLQEKAQDRQSEIDELRAKRYQESKDREWRNAELQVARKSNAMKTEIASARLLQREEKETRMAEQAMLERAEYQRVLDWQRQQLDDDREREEHSLDARAHYRDDLLRQIHAREDQQARKRVDFLKEGDVIGRQMISEKAKLEGIKRRKMRDLQDSGVPKKYWTGLSRKKVLDANPFFRA
jgi:hypothetical protein